MEDREGDLYLQADQVGVSLVPHLTLVNLSKSDVNGVAEAILKLQNGVRLFVGKIVDVVRVCTLSPTVTVNGSLLV